MEKVLEIKNLTKKYKSADRKAVDNISFDVYAGEFFCLLGINGAGKSTTINMLCTLLKTTSGEVKLHDYVLGKDDNMIRHNIGVVFQGNVLDDKLTVEENILSRAAFYGLDKKVAKERIEKIAKQLSMNEFLNSRYAKLSGGQRRKCDIARALLSEPKILFLDEPTTGLDPQSRIELWDTIKKVQKHENITVFLTTHYMEETENSDRIAIIDKGHILCIDTPQRLKTKYSNDILRLIVKKDCNKDIESYLDKYEVIADTYIIEFENGVDAIELLTKVKPYIDSFELEKGNMDNVFLNVVKKGGSYE